MEKNELLSRLNRWWQNGQVKKAFLYKSVRSEFYEIDSLLSYERILAITGPRRVGKSTLIYQTIDNLIKKGTDPKRILFLTGDEPVLFSKTSTIGDVLEGYFNEILHESVDELFEKVYVFIDEIHVISDWQLWLKSYYDKKYKIKFVVSGSSSTHLFFGAKESLLGRIETINVMPLTFFQFCSFWADYKNDEKVAGFIKALPEGCLIENPSNYFEKLEKDKWKYAEFIPYVNRVLKEYLLIGGYPEYFVEMSSEIWQKRLAGDIIAQGLYRDIVSIYNVKSPERLEKLLYFIAENNGQDFNYKTISDILGCDNETVTNYISFLSQAYLAIVLENYSNNVGKIIRKNKTMYVLDNGIGNALLHLDSIDSTREGRLIENLCVRDALAVSEKNYWKLYYWREGSYEIDIIIDKKTELLPIEVKFRNDPCKEDNINEFVNRFNKEHLKIKESLVITKDYLGKRGNVYYVPFYMMK